MKIVQAQGNRHDVKLDLLLIKACDVSEMRVQIASPDVLHYEVYHTISLKHKVSTNYARMIGTF